MMEFTCIGRQPRLTNNMSSVATYLLVGSCLGLDSEIVSD